jgi:hypothetical protein
LSAFGVSPSDMPRANCSVIVKSGPPLPSGTTLHERPGPSTPELSRIVTSTADAIPGWLSAAVPVLGGRRPLELNAGAIRSASRAPSRASSPASAL